MVEDFKTFEMLAWERKALGYSDTWGTVTTQPIEKVLEVAGDVAGKMLLDCGCGPGQLTYIASQKGARVIGGDYSQQMLQIASKNFPDLEFSRQDAEQLTFSDNYFDIVVLNYLLLHVQNQDLVLHEAERVLKPGGKLIYTMWMAPDKSPGLNLIFSAIKRFADMSVIPPAQDLFYYSSELHAREFFNLQRFAELYFSLFPTAWNVSSAEQFFQAIQAGTRMGGLIELQKEEIKRQIKDSILTGIEQFHTQSGYLIPTPSIIVSARKL